MKCLAAILVYIMGPLLSLLRLYCPLSCADLTAHQAILWAELEAGFDMQKLPIHQNRSLSGVVHPLAPQYTLFYELMDKVHLWGLSVQKGLAPVTKSRGRMKGFVKVLVSIHFRGLELYLIHGFPCLQSCCVFCTLRLEEVSDGEFMLHQQVKIFAVSCGGTG